MISIMRKLEFDAGHRVMGHEGKCATLHGHRYVVEVWARAKQLDSIGRVIDFSVLKAKLGKWLDETWDHTTIVFAQDEATISALLQCPGHKQPAIVPFNPTAENMASYLLLSICPKLFADDQVEVFKIDIWETPNCKATASL